jgi:hypothetical protein
MTVPERLLEIRPALALAGLIGILAAAVLYGVGLGAQLPDYPLGKSDIAARAREVVAAQGFDDARSLVVPMPVGEARSLLNAAVGVAEARRASLSGELPVSTWRVRVRRDYFVNDLDDDPGGVDLRFGETGTLLGAEFPEPRRKEPAPARDEAKRIALERIASFGLSLDDYTEKSENPESDDVKINLGGDAPSVEAKSGEPPATNEIQTRQEVLWEREAPGRSGLTLAVSAKVTASGLTSFSRVIRYADDPDTADEVPTLFQNIFFGVFCVLLVPLLMAIGILRFITKEYVKRRRALLACTVLAVSSAAAVFVTTSLDESILLTLLGATLVPLLVAIPVFCAWLIGEADAYYVWGKHVTEGALAVLTFRPFSRQVARETQEGYLWGWTGLGALAVIAAAVASLAGPDAVRQTPVLEIAKSSPMWLFWVDAIPYTLAVASMGYLFMTSWAQRLLKRPWLSLSIASVAVALFAQGFHLISLSVGPLPRIATWGLPLAVGACLLTVRRGLLTAVAATFALSTWYFGLAGLVVGTIGEHASAAAGLAIVAIPPVLAFAFGHRLPQVQVREAPPPRVSAMLERARREQELGIAHRVQSGLLPTDDPEVEGFDVAGVCRPANEVGGDYFDYFKLPDGRFGIAVGDVSGKGVPAAFFMTMTKGFMEVAATEAREPEGVLSQANGHLRDTLAKGTFVTMAYAILDPESSVVTFARAGHNPPILAGTSGPAELVAPPGTALGAAPPGVFDRILAARRLELRRGDVLVFYTDGVTEAMNPTHQEFGEERLLAAIERHRDGLSARALVGKVLEDVAEFSQGASQHDDITLVVIKAS